MNTYIHAYVCTCIVCVLVCTSKSRFSVCIQYISEHSTWTDMHIILSILDFSCGHAPRCSSRVWIDFWPPIPDLKKLVTGLISVKLC